MHLVDLPLVYDASDLLRIIARGLCWADAGWVVTEAELSWPSDCMEVKSCMLKLRSRSDSTPWPCNRRDVLLHIIYWLTTVNLVMSVYNLSNIRLRALLKGFAQLLSSTPGNSTLTTRLQLNVAPWYYNVCYFSYNYPLMLWDSCPVKTIPINTKKANGRLVKFSSNLAICFFIGYGTAILKQERINLSQSWMLSILVVCCGINISIPWN